MSGGCYIQAYSCFDEDLGYCQGLAFVAGALLMKMPEESAFHVLASLLNDYGLRSLYQPDMEGLLLSLHQFDHLLTARDPELSNHFAQQGVTADMYATQWFLTCFGAVSA